MQGGLYWAAKRFESLHKKAGVISLAGIVLVALSAIEICIECVEIDSMDEKYHSFGSDDRFVC